VSTSCSNVGVGRLNKLWCIYFTLAFAVGIVYAWLACSVPAMGFIFALREGAQDGGYIGGVMGKVHSPMASSLAPARTNLLW